MRLRAAAALLFATTISAQAATFSASGLGIEVDSGSQNYDFAIGPSEAGTILDLTIAVGFSVCDDVFTSSTGPCTDNGGSTFNEELTLALISPTGTIVELVTAGTYSGQDEGASVVVTFDDAAATVVGGSLVTTGTFRPISALSAFDGEGVAGLWTLRIGDTAGGDPKRLDSIDFTAITTVAAVPLPAGGVLLIGGLGAIGAARLRRRAA
jgi:hypothetical protein